jgi:large subunit ribosomal protein L25
VIPVNFINEDECLGIKEDGGVVAKAIREIEIMCLAGNIPESIDIDIEKLHLGESIRLTEISLPEGSEIPGLTEEVSINEPRAIEEDPIEEEVELEEGEVAEGDATSEEASENDSSSSDEPSKEDGSEES